MYIFVSNDKLKLFKKNQPKWTIMQNGIIMKLFINQCKIDGSILFIYSKSWSQCIVVSKF